MKYPALKAAADAERKKQKLTKQILELKDNSQTRTELLAMGVEKLKKMVSINKPVKSKKTVSDL